MDIQDDPQLAPLEKAPEGVRIGECILTRRIGAGGMGTVYCGKHLALDIEVAVKILPFHAAAADSTVVTRFQQEARATVRIDHPNIVRVFHVGEEHGVHYLVMEFVEGETAAARVERDGPLPESEALEIATATGEALAAAHAKGILHRDVKPSNILIRAEDGHVKLADLGLAKAMGGESGSTAGLTATGQVLGTPAYMSPEQAEDASRADERTDIYSLGATLYTLLSGKAPFEATQLYRLIRKVVEEEPEDIRSHRADVTTATAEAVRKLMAKDVADRPQTMKQAVELLRSCLEEAPAEGKKRAARPRKKRKGKKKAAAKEPASTAEEPKTLDDVTPSMLRAKEGATTVSEAEPPARTGASKRSRKLAIGVVVLVLAGGTVAYLAADRRPQWYREHIRAEKSLKDAHIWRVEAGTLEMNNDIQRALVRYQDWVKHRKEALGGIRRVERLKASLPRGDEGRRCRRSLDEARVLYRRIYRLSEEAEATVNVLKERQRKENKIRRLPFGMYRQ